MTMFRARRTAALAAAGLTLGTLGAGALASESAQAAHTPRVTATIKLSGDGDYLRGKIGSGAGSCKKRVLVKLKWLPPGSKSYRVVRTDVTTNRGAWAVHKPKGSPGIPAGKYYAAVKTRGCSPARSRTLTINGPA